MNKALGAVLVAGMLPILGACVTPPVVKQAVADLDSGYTENIKLMQQYRQLVGKINERQRYWNLYVTQRHLLDLALRSITRNDWVVATVTPGETPSPADAADATAQLLGDDLLAMVNDLRFEGLAAQRGSENRERFKAGTSGNNPAKLAERMPELVNRVTLKVQQDYAKVTVVSGDATHFTAYLTNVAALQQINAAVKRYLDIDVTVSPKDVSEIATAIRQLQE